KVCVLSSTTHFTVVSSSANGVSEIQQVGRMLGLLFALDAASTYLCLGRVHTTRRASTISAKHRKAEKTTSSFSKREKIRRKPFKRRNSRSISLRFLYSSRS